MEKLKILQKADETDKHIYYAISADQFTEQPLNQCYDKYGQQIGHYNADDYCLKNTESCAHGDLAQEFAERYLIDQMLIEEFDPETNLPVFKEGYVSELQPEEIECMSNFVKQWREDNEVFETVTSYTYWDGHNWQSVTIDGHEPNFIECDDETSKRINEVLSQLGGKETNMGMTDHECPEGFNVTSAVFSAHWEDYRIEEM